MQKRRASIPSKGWKVSFKSAFKKRANKAKTLNVINSRVEFEEMGDLLGTLFK